MIWYGFYKKQEEKLGFIIIFGLLLKNGKISDTHCSKKPTKTL
jgi:hypothetical protein